MARKLALRLLPAAGVAAALALLAIPHTNDAAAPQPSRAAVPILMYHQLRTAPDSARQRALYVRPRDFAAQVRGLRRAGYTAVTLQRVWDAWHGRATLPRRPVVFSFDDGYASQVRVALPVLRRYRWPGVLNLAVDWIDDLGGDAAVRRLIEAGWQIDGHSRTHPDLTKASDARLRAETAGARTELQQRFGVDAGFFAYPFGRYDDRVIAALREAGYLAATTVKRGLATRENPYALARVQVSSGTSADDLLRRLRELRSRRTAARR
jgi:peptidoglycan/xylan/chitin deacetylase (PgdA/CDA1 family)